MVYGQLEHPDPYQHGPRVHEAPAHPPGWRRLETESSWREFRETYSVLCPFHAVPYFHIPIPPLISTPVLHQAVHIFLNDMVVHTPSSGAVSKGHLTGLVALVLSASSNEALPTALEAVALASRAARFKVPELRVEGMRLYARVVWKLVEGDLGEGREVVACMVLLGLYEVSSSTRGVRCDEYE